jgi:hypothetical protein
MSEKKQYQTITKEELRERIKVLTTPIDFDALIQAGVLEKQGAWYKVIKWGELPPHATGKVKSIKQTNKGMFVTFYPVDKKLAKMVE